MWDVKVRVKMRVSKVTSIKRWSIIKKRTDNKRVIGGGGYSYRLCDYAECEKLMSVQSKIQWKSEIYLFWLKNDYIVS